MAVGGRLVHVSVQRRLAVAVFVAGAYGGLVEIVETFYLHTDLRVDTVQGVLGLVFGGLLVFRTNAAYARWWEGRTLWGALVNTSRNFMIKIMTLPRVSPVEKEHVGRLVVAFAYALRNRLRGGAAADPVPGLDADAAAVSHVPVEIVERIYAHLARWRDEGAIDSQELRILDFNANAFLDVCGGCERISRTPMVPSYVHYVRVCIVLYLALLPWALKIDILLAPVTMLWAYFLCGLELIAETIEDPFGSEVDDLQIDDICAGIGSTVQQVVSSDAPTASC